MRSFTLSTREDTARHIALPLACVDRPTDLAKERTLMARAERAAKSESTCSETKERSADTQTERKMGRKGAGERKETEMNAAL